MKAEILSTGDEIRTGALVDTNSAYLAEKLEENNVEVMSHHCVGDHPETISGILKEIGSRADIAVVTGGLGPTTDDVTADAAADAAGVGLVLNESALEGIENFFRLRNYPMSPSNRKQAMIPQGAECLPNPVGTAPGFALTVGGCRFFFMPGVPVEMKKMFDESVLPKILTLAGKDEKFRMVTTLVTFGLPESTAGERVAELETSFPCIRLGLRARFPEIQIKLYAQGNEKSAVQKEVAAAKNLVAEKMGKYLLSDDGRPMEIVIGDLLLENKATIAIAESCTGGIIARMLTSAAGSSDFFLFSGVTYSNAAKMKVLGVSSETLDRNGAVHEQTAREMAEGARRVAGADFGLSTTGIAGPSGGSDEKPVGTVCIGLATDQGSKGFRYFFPFAERSRNQKIFAYAALEILRRHLKKIE